MLRYLSPIRGVTDVLQRSLKHKIQQYKPALPTVLNFMVNDICNSKCGMCNIWQQKKDIELTPSDLQQILENPLFAKITGVGVSGGEPTLRTDLAEMYEVICSVLPRLKGTGIITNAIKAEEVIERISESTQVADHYGKSFNIMVSLD